MFPSQKFNSTKIFFLAVKLSKEGFFLILDQLSDMMPSPIVGNGGASTDM